MDEAGIDVVIATSKHNVQYLLGGHRANFFDYMDATGVTRYLPVFVYPKGAPEKAAYIGHRLEKFQTRGHADVDAGDADQYLRARSTPCRRRSITSARRGSRPKRIAAEFGFLPYDASIVLRNAFPDAEWVDALFVLERQRVKKSADELAKLKYRLGSRARLDASRRSPQPRPGVDQSRDGRGAAPRGNQSRAYLRILPDHRRHQHEPRALRSEMGEGRHHVDR